MLRLFLIDWVLKCYWVNLTLAQRSFNNTADLTHISFSLQFVMVWRICTLRQRFII